MIKKRRCRDLSKIDIVHHELDEVIDPEFVKDLHKMVANKLFSLWLEERKRNGVTKEAVRKAA